MKFNWEEFLSNDNIAVHCSTEEQAIDFCRQMHEHGLSWRDGQSYLKNTSWKTYKEETAYEGGGCFADVNYYTGSNYTILEWADYEKENGMNLELSNLTDEQKKQIIDLAKKFEQENDVDKLDYDNDFCTVTFSDRVEKVNRYINTMAQDMFDLGLTERTKEEAEKIRRRLLVEKELRDWAKKCKEPLMVDNAEVGKYMIAYEAVSNRVYAETYFTHIFGEILFSKQKVAEQAIKAIGQERLIRDYFGIEREEK